MSESFTMYRDVKKSVKTDEKGNRIVVAEPGEVHYEVDGRSVTEDMFNKLDLLQKIEVFLEHNPELRIGQIVVNAALFGGWKQTDIFYCDDITLLRGLLRMLSVLPLTKGHILKPETKLHKGKEMDYLSGYFLEIEKYLAAAKLNTFFIEDGGEEEINEAIDNLEHVKIVVRDLLETLREE